MEIQNNDVVDLENADGWQGCCPANPFFSILRHCVGQPVFAHPDFPFRFSFSPPQAAKIVEAVESKRSRISAKAPIIDRFLTVFRRAPVTGQLTRVASPFAGED